MKPRIPSVPFASASLRPGNLAGISGIEHLHIQLQDEIRMRRSTLDDFPQLWVCSCELDVRETRSLSLRWSSCCPRMAYVAEEIAWNEESKHPEDYQGWGYYIHPQHIDDWGYAIDRLNKINQCRVVRTRGDIRIKE